MSTRHSWMCACRDARRCTRTRILVCMRTRACISSSTGGRMHPAHGSYAHASCTCILCGHPAHASYAFILCMHP
eukprot:6183370-Pleurochrysis_carterae.AAC.7